MPRGAIAGVVVDAVSHRPLDGAVVNLTAPSGSGAPASRQLTDRAGRFLFDRLPAIEGYSLQASHAGYFDGAFGRDSPRAALRTISLSTGQLFNRADVVMWPYAEIAGTVRNGRDEPVAGALVRVFSEAAIAGVTEFIAGAFTTTDDRGMYRAGGLVPGRYAVQLPAALASVPAGLSIEPPKPAPNNRSLATLDVERDYRLIADVAMVPTRQQDRWTAYPPTFFPAARRVGEATVLDLAAGQVIDGIDFRVSREPTVHVAGYVEGMSPLPSPLTLRLIERGNERLGLGSEVASTIVDGHGQFLFPHVPAGDYVLLAQRSVLQYDAPLGVPPTTTLALPPGFRTASYATVAVGAGPEGTSYSTRTLSGGPWYWATETLNAVDRDIDQVAVRLQEARTLTGRVVLAPEVKSELRPTFVVIAAEPADGNALLGAPTSRLSPAGSSYGFVLDGMQRGGYVFHVRGATGFQVKSVTIGGKDYRSTQYDPFDAPVPPEIVITLTDATTEVAGLVTDNAGRPAVTATVLAFPVQTDRWVNYGLNPTDLRAASVTSAGTFSFRALPAGDYFLIAVADQRRAGACTPEFLQAASRRASRISVGWGSTIRQNLVVSRP